MIGDVWEWSITLSNYPASDNWVLSYILKQAGSDAKTITASVDTDGISHKIKVSDTTSYLPGKYKISICITSSDEERQTLGITDIELLPDMSTVDDPRTYNEKCLDAIEQVLAGTASRDILEYTFKDANYKFRSTTELIRLRNYYEQEVNREKGIKSGRIVYINKRY